MTTPHRDVERWLQQHLDALYLRDRRERLYKVNQWDSGPVPRLHLVRSSAGNIWRYRDDLPDDLILRLNAICLEEPAAMTQTPQHADRLIALLAQHTPVQSVRQGPIYAFPDAVKNPHSADARIVSITGDNASLLRPAMPDWLPDVPHRAPFLAVVCDERAVAVCASVRITPRCHQAGVESAPAYRKRGYAAAVVSAWARAVRELGAQPIYSTSWDNQASQAVARRLGLELIGVDFHVN
jgi:GNAT superfamily N-acetyltransferase